MKSILQILSDKKSILQEAVFPSGKHHGKSPDQVDDEYLKWYLEKIADDASLEYLASEILDELGYDNIEQFKKDLEARQHGFFGEIDKVYNIIVKITDIKKEPTAYGVKYKYKARVKDEFTVRFTADQGLGVETGEYYGIAAQVNKFKKYEDKRTVILNSVKLVGKSTKKHYDNYEPPIYVKPPEPVYTPPPPPPPKSQPVWTPPKPVHISSPPKPTPKPVIPPPPVSEVEIPLVMADVYARNEEEGSSWWVDSTEDKFKDLDETQKEEKLVKTLRLYRKASKEVKEELFNKLVKEKNHTAISIFPPIMNGFQKKALDYLIKNKKASLIYNAGLEEEEERNLWVGGWPNFHYTKALSALKKLNHSFYKGARYEWPMEKVRKRKSAINVAEHKKTQEILQNLPDEDLEESFDPRILELAGLPKQNKLKLLLEGISNYEYNPPSNKEELLYDFYTLVGLPGSEVIRDENLSLAFDEVQKDVLYYVRKNLLNAVFYCLACEFRHIFDRNSTQAIKAWFAQLGESEFFEKYEKTYNAIKGGTADKSDTYRFPKGKERYEGSGSSRAATYKALISTHRPRADIIAIIRDAFGVIKMGTPAATNETKYGNKNRISPNNAEATVRIKPLAWASSYGGPAWGNIAVGWLMLHYADSIKTSKLKPPSMEKTLSKLGDTPPDIKSLQVEKEKEPEEQSLGATGLISAIDHVYDLQHNTGVVFTKVTQYQVNGGYGWLKNALDFKANERNPWRVWEKASTGLKWFMARVAYATGGGTAEMGFAGEGRFKSFGPYNIETGDIVRLKPHASNVDHLKWGQNDTAAKRYNGKIVKVTDASKTQYSFQGRLYHETSGGNQFGYEVIDEKLTKQKADEEMKDILSTLEKEQKEQLEAQMKADKETAEKQHKEKAIANDTLIFDKVKLKSNAFIPNGSHAWLNGMTVGVYDKAETQFRIKLNEPGVDPNVLINYTDIEKKVKNAQIPYYNKDNISSGDKVIIKKNAKRIDTLVWEKNGAMDYLAGQTVTVVEKIDKNFKVKDKDSNNVWRLGYITIDKKVDNMSEDFKRILDLSGILTEADETTDPDWAEWEQYLLRPRKAKKQSYKWPQAHKGYEVDDYDDEEYYNQHAYKPIKQEYYKLKQVPLSSLPGKLYTHRMPHGYPEIPEQWKENNIEIVFSLLEIKQHNPKVYQENGVRGINRPIVDFSVPSYEQAKSTIQQIYAQLKRGKNVSIHCFGGNGRTGIMVAILYSLINKKPMPQTLKEIREINPKYVENKKQEKFVQDFVIRYIEERKQKKEDITSIPNSSQTFLKEIFN